jgi:hypothetical protein
MKSNSNSSSPDQGIRSELSINPPIHFLKQLFFFLLFTCFCGTEGLQAQWVQQGADINGEAALDQSGTTVSISADGSTIAIGAQLNDAGGTDIGHVRVYKNISGVWTLQGSEINGEADSDFFGGSVSLSSNGNIVAIGANGNDGGGTDRGSVEIYEYNGSVWTQLGADIDGEADSDGSGTSVSLSSDGSIVAIGAPNNDGGGTTSGHVRVYKYMGGAWVLQGADINGEAGGNSSGNSVSISADGSIVAIGAPFNDDVGLNSGQVEVYEYNGSAWIQLGADLLAEGVGDLYGSSVSLNDDGNILAIGGYQNDGNGSNSGHVRVFEFIAGSWVQIGADLDGEAGDDWSGNSVSLDSVGSTVAIGAFLNNGGGFDRGHARVYKNISGTWTQTGSDINGESNDDRSGISVSISSDGSIVAIGAHQNDGNGSNSGHVRVYKNCPSFYNSSDMIYYCSLEDALAGASSGDVIQIAAGTYSSPCFTIDESVTLTPVGGAVILGCLEMNGSGKTMEMGGNLTINNLTLTTGKISTNGFNLSAGTITGGDPATYIITD